ncbi:Transcription factor E [uncultured archaeon]|nr:Transcription factor E [uncultured archaeon]
MQKKTVKKTTEKKAAVKTTEKYDHLYDFVQKISGDNGLKVFQIIGDGVTDDVIEKKANIKVAEVRSILNHLHSFGVVDYSREKNLTTGWYTYTWKINEERAVQNYIQSLKKEKKMLAERASGLDNTVTFYSKKTGRSFSFEEAFENQFKCPETGNTLKEIDKNQERKSISKRIQEIDKTLAEHMPRVIVE